MQSELADAYIHAYEERQIKRSDDFNGDSQEGVGYFQMETNRDRREKFIEAQAKYSANIHIITTMSTQSATSLKSIGVALSAISRKQ